MFLLLPSLLTAFTVVASMEHGARQRGGEGYVGWLTALPWRDPIFTGMALAGLMFAAAGFSGMINAGMNINYLVHNTWWVVGHFHLTVGTAVALTFMAAAYWFIPQLTGKELWNRSVALGQVLLWFIGMTFMSNAMHRSGLFGMPRRTAEPQYQGFEFEPAVGTVGEINAQVALGAVLLTVSLALFLLNMVMTSFNETSDAIPDNTFAGTLSGPEDSPAILDNLALWTAIAVVLVIFAYTLPLASIIDGGGLFGSGIDGFQLGIETGRALVLESIREVVPCDAHLEGALLVVIAVLVPVIVELRTALSWFGIELSILESLGLSAVLILGLVLWAVWPPNGDAEAEPSSSN